MSLQVHISNSDLRRLERNLNRAMNTNRRQVRQWIKGAAIVGESVAGVSAPVDTGRLRQSIRFKMVGELEAVVYTNVTYAKYQNNGTSRIRGKRFMEKGYLAGSKYLMRKIRSF